MSDHQANECPYQVNEAYPPVRVDGPNPAYACEILSNVGGCVSEMSDVSRYFYNSVVTGPQYQSISACYHRISIVEMHHLDIFAKLALLLGTDPRLWCGRERKRWWTPDYNRYPREIRALIGCSIEAEKAAIRKYSAQADSICDQNIVAILRRIILDEESHIRAFEEMYQQI